MEEEEKEDEHIEEDCCCIDCWNRKEDERLKNN